jgi:hypothetical protein
MLILALFMQAATPAARRPAPTPTPAIYESDDAPRPTIALPTPATRTLSDVARERRGKLKPAGGFSASGLGSGPTPTPEIDPSGYLVRHAPTPAGPTPRAGSASSTTPQGTPGASGPEPILSVESVDAPGVSGLGNVWIDGNVANRGDAAACYVHVLMRVYYAEGARDVAGSRETIIDRIEPHSNTPFKSFVEAAPDLGMSEKQTSGNSVQYGRPMKKMGRVDAVVTSFDRCRGGR